MLTLDVQISAKEPLAMRSDSAPQGEKTAHFISGSTFLGAMASAYCFFYGDAAGDFTRFFHSGAILYPYLYPANCLGEAADAQRPVYPIPKTAISCKRHPGYSSRLKHDLHGVLDSLLDWAQFKLSGERDSNRLEAHRWCSVCGAAMEYPKEAFYRRLPPAKDADRPDNRFEAEIKTRLQTRTGIDRRRNIVEEGILYNREVIVEGSRFWGTVRLAEDQDLLNDFKSFLDDVNDAELLRIGTGRTRGLGKINLHYHEQDPEDTPDRQKAAFCQRLETFHEAVCRVTGSTNAFYFAVTLHSPLLRHDGWLRARTTLNEEDMAELTGLPKELFRQWYQAAGVRRITGWSDIWGTPRTQDYALDTGSVFLFSSSHHPKEELIDRLFSLEEKGAGLHLSEGFGRLCISDTFHTEGEHV